jgi:hypothetical protein
MKIETTRPPNFEQILAAFPDADKPGVIFAFGTTIHNPSGGNISPALLAHEAVHLKRQVEISRGADKWWDAYIHDAEFRYWEELYAHVAEYKAQALHRMDRNFKAKLLQATALRLIAPLYNYQPPRTLAQAMRDLRWELDK